MAPRASGEVQGALAEERVPLAARPQPPMAANALVPRDSDQLSAKATATPVVIEFAEAIALLGGRLRLVEGLVPSRLARAGDEIQVVYHTMGGVLILSQQRDGDELTWRLHASPGFPADSLEVLRRRVGR